MAGTNPRAARIAALIQRVIASSMEAQLHDKRLTNVTITEVRVTNDLQIAKVYWTQLGREGHEQGERHRAQQALNQAKGRLRSLVGTKAGLRLTRSSNSYSTRCRARRMRSKTFSPSRASVTKNSPRLVKPPSMRAKPIRTSIRKRMTTMISTMMTSKSKIGMMTKKPEHSGLLVIDKPQGVTSHDVVAAVRGALHMKRVGHAGTLDPMATGVLVVGFGNATRLLNYIVDHNKTYEATIRLGQRTTTDDAEGELLPAGERAVNFPSRQAVEQLITERFTGRIEQVPNVYSAIKVNGQRAYDLAREGKDVELKARPVTIEEFNVRQARYGYTHSDRAGTELAGAVVAERAGDGWIADTAPHEDMQPVMELDVTVTCSAGTYIRALARDLGEELGLGGHLTMLRRTRVGRFSVNMPNVMSAHAESKTFTNREGMEVTRNRAVLDDADHALDHALDPVASAAASMNMLAVSDQEAADLRFGRRIAHDIRTTTAAYVEETNDLVAILERAKRGEAKPVAVFN